MENNNQNNEPVVLGVLRKEKSSKPIFVFIVLTLIIGITFALPYVEDYIKNPDTFLGKIYYSIITTEPNSNDNQIVDKNSKYILNDKTNIVNNNINLSNILLENNQITYHIKTTTNSVNLNNSNYYLEIYDSGDNLLERVKLTGIITTTNQEKNYIFNELRINSATSYFGKINELKEDNYSEIILNTPDTLTCNKEKNQYQYKFLNNQLININQDLIYDDISNINIYLNYYQKYNSIVKDINIIKNNSANIEETDSGFVFSADLDLNIFTKEKLGISDDINYYNLNTLAKIIKYDLELQGYECK